MNKLSIMSLVAGAAMFILPIAASAATISTPLFSNGDTTIDAQGGSTVSGTFVLQVNANEVCEVLRTQADASQPVKDTSVGGQLGYQQGTYTNVPFSVTVPPNTGTYYPTVQCAGIWGGNRSVDGADNVVVGPQNLGTLRVTATGSSSSGPVVGSDDFWTKLATLIAGILKTNTPTASAACTQLASYSGFSVGMTGVNVASAQSFIMGHGGFIPAISNGSATPGYWGNQSAMALVQAKVSNSCN